MRLVVLEGAGTYKHGHHFGLLLFFAKLLSGAGCVFADGLT